MKRIIVLLMVVLAAIMFLKVATTLLHKSPQEHTTLQTFEEIESWRDND